MPPMGRLFGTDGVRGVANRDLTPDLALALGRAAGCVLGSEGAAVVVGRDTRVSGTMLQSGLVAGLCSSGVEVWVAGVVPSPAVAFFVLDDGAAAGAMISASHNPVGDNGIKFFSDAGAKLPAELEDRIESLVAEPPARDLPVGTEVGVAADLERPEARYIEHLLASLDGDLAGMKVVIDCAYGAAWSVGPEALRRAGADVVALHAEPDGARINVECGSTAPAALAEAVMEEGADLGLALDGDADRVVAVDATGTLVDGDRMLALLALELHERDALDGNVVVVTVMSNLGMTRALAARGIEVVQAPVGDRYVVEAMLDRGAVLGGEQSGHIVLGRHAKTGDGLLAGLQLARLVRRAGAPLDELTALYHAYAQTLLNVPVRAKDALEGADGVWDEVAESERRLGDTGRVLVRTSGTEPVVRVLVEAEDARVAADEAQRIAAAVERLLD
jgi:phosphoglucosamine mutase